MGRLDELNKRIKSQLEEINGNQKARQRVIKKLHRIDLRADEIEEELPEARSAVKRAERALAEVRSALEEAEAESPGEDTPEEQELKLRRDELAGAYEQAIDIRDRLLSKLDLLGEREDKARQLLKQIVGENEDDRRAVEKMRARRKRIKEARARNDRPSPNFDWAEFDCNDGTPFPEESKPAIRDWCQRVGEPARAKYGSVHVNSGHRHSEYNRRVGGEPNSVHIYDFPGRDHKAVAVDFTCERGTPSEWYAFTAGKAAGRGRYNTFHHADTRDRLGWSPATWTG